MTTPARETSELHADYRARGDVEVRDELFERHQGLARRLAAGYANRGEAFDDLHQVAQMALVKAIERFDPERGVQFSTYATATINGELKRHFRDRAWAIRTSRTVQERYLAVRDAREVLSQRLRRSPTIAEVAEYVGSNEEEVIEAFDAGANLHTIPLDIGAAATAASGDEGSREPGADDPAFTHVEHRHEVWSLLSHLPDREREIVTMRFVNGMTQAQIGQAVGLSQMHVSRLLARALERMRRIAAAANDV